MAAVFQCAARPQDWKPTSGARCPVCRRSIWSIRACYLLFRRGRSLSLSWRTRIGSLQSVRLIMSSRWSPHPRYRLYTTRASYTVPLFNARDSVERFETEVCRRFNVAAAACVPMARVGLFFALREMIRPGQKVILSPLTIVDVVNAVLLAGGVPVFADIVRRSCAIDIDKAYSLIDGSTAALLLTHLHGETAGQTLFGRSVNGVVSALSKIVRRHSGQSNAGNG